jgi:hypothetical protein
MRNQLYFNLLDVFEVDQYGGLLADVRGARVCHFDTILWNEHTLIHMLNQLLIPVAQCV